MRGGEIKSSRGFEQLGILPRHTASCSRKFWKENDAVSHRRHVFRFDALSIKSSTYGADQVRRDSRKRGQAERDGEAEEAPRTHRALPTGGRWRLERFVRFISLESTGGETQFLFRGNAASQKSDVRALLLTPSYPFQVTNIASRRFGKGSPRNL